MDNGKPYKEAYFLDFSIVVDTLKYYAGWSDKVCGRTIPIGRLYQFALYRQTHVIQIINE